MLDQAKAERGAPQYIRMDNGPELIASAIRDWCRLSATGTLYIEPGSPWEKTYATDCTSFIGLIATSLQALWAVAC